MKFFLWFFGILIGGIILFVVLFHWEENKDAVSRTFGRALEAQSIQTPVPVVQATPPPTVQLNPTQAVSNAALEAGLNSQVLQQQGNTLFVQLEWGGQNPEQHQAFLQYFVRNRIIVTPTIVSPLETAVNDRGQTRYKLSYQIVFK